jgi:hypothetical protein
MVCLQSIYFSPFFNFAFPSLPHRPIKVFYFFLPPLFTFHKCYFHFSNLKKMNSYIYNIIYIRCIGGRPKSFASEEDFFHTTYTYTLAFARALSLVMLAPRFRFCYLSCWGADPTESKFRPIDKLHAYLKGKTEMALFGIVGALVARGWELYTFRPGTVLDKAGEIGKNGFGGIKGMVVPTIDIRLLEVAVMDVSQQPSCAFFF